MHGFHVPRQRIELAFEPCNHPPAHPSRSREDDEEGISHRDLLVQIVDEPEDAFDAGVEDEGSEAVDD